LTEAQLKERFPQVYEAGLRIPLDYKQKDSKEQPVDNGIQKATIFEIWDKATETVYWVHKDIQKPLDVREDPLKLKGFFPCPRPLFANLANDSCIPTPDYHQFKDQAKQLDQLTGRISLIVKCIKVAGVYDKSAQGIERLLSEGVENQLLGVESWMQFADKGGLKSAMDLLPVKDIAETMMTLYDARERTKQDLYEITGIADIIRGATDPRETAAAQQMKGQFATLRLGDRQAEIQRYARDTIRLMGEIIANKFQGDAIKKISGVRLFTEQEKQVYGMALQQTQAGQQPIVPLPKDLRPDELQDVLAKPSWEEVEQLLRDEPARCFRIDIQTDSTIKADKQMERAEKLDFLQNVSSFLSQAVTATESNPDIAPVLAQMLMFGVRAFDVDKDLEQTLNTFITKTQQSQGQPKPDKEQMKIQAQQQGEQAKMQAQAQIEQAKLQASVQLEQQKAQINAQLEEKKMMLQVQAEQAKQQAQGEQETLHQQNQMTLEQHKHDQLMQLEQFKIQAETDRALAIEKLKSDTQILVAQISAQQAVTTAEMAAEAKADTEVANA